MPFTVSSNSLASRWCIKDQPLATVKRVGPILLVVLPLFVPEVVIEFTSLRVDSALVIAGILPAIIGWTYAPRYALMAIPLAAVLNALAVLVFGHPLATTLLMVCIAVAVGLSALWGLHPVAAFAAIQPAIVVISGYHTVSVGTTTPGVVGQALIGAGVVIVGGLWAVLIGWALLRDESSGPPARVPPRIVIFYTGALVLLLAVGAFIASMWFLETTAGWVLLTVLLVTRPTYDESKQMIRERGLGTVAGGVVAAVVAVIVSDSTALVAIGTLTMVVAAVLQLQHARYAYFAVFVTAAIVLVDAQRSNVFEIDLERVVYSLVGVALVVVAVAAAETVLGRSTPPRVS
jgi:Fusaric acid resistance protein-like